MNTLASRTVIATAPIADLSRVTAAAYVGYASAEYFASLERQERVGVILRRSEYTVPAILSVPERRRVAFMVRLDGGIGSEIVTIDQALDVSAALLQENEQVLATIVNNVHVESTVSPIFGHCAIEQFPRSTTFSGKVLRSGALGAGADSAVALLVLTDKAAGSQLVELCVESNDLGKISPDGTVHVNILADGTTAIV